MRRITRRVSAADARRPVRGAQERKLEPFSGSVVSPLRDCSAWKTPPENVPENTWPALVEAAVKRIVPRRVSRIDPTGSSRAAVRATNRRPLIPGTDRLANAPLAGTLTKTFPLTGCAATLLARTGTGPAATGATRISRLAPPPPPSQTAKPWPSGATETWVLKMSSERTMSTGALHVAPPLLDVA